jgi:WD40 repeat protein
MLASASCDNMARIWDVGTGKTLHVLEGHKGFVNAVIFLRDGKTLATGGEDGTIRLWDISTGGQVRQILAHEIGQREDGDRRRDVFALALSPDGKRLASAGRDTMVKVWDVAALLQDRR